MTLDADVAILDRGAAARPEPLLPILDGGLDQTPCVVGLVRLLDLGRSGRRGPAPPPLLLSLSRGKVVPPRRRAGQFFP